MNVDDELAVVVGIDERDDIPPMSRGYEIVNVGGRNL
jgi:hypothetical protein